MILDRTLPWPWAAYTALALLTALTGAAADQREPSSDHWSLQPLQRPGIPIASGSSSNSWIRNPIDAFVLQRLESRGLSPSSEASRPTLVRRLYFDLIGLPPTPAEVQAFIQDPDPQAYERLVDRLLADPRHGERWARHWLDTVRYGETHGYDKDKPRLHAWPYRDYVIQSLNQDQPYDRFVREQIAGDVLHPGSPQAIAATGFLAAGPWDFIGHVEVGEAKLDGRIAKHLDRDEMVAAVFNTFLSTTVQCAQCHHHKFDPISMQDYYRLHAVFAAVDRADRVYRGLSPAQLEQKAALQNQIGLLETRRKEIESSLQQTIAARTSKMDARLAVLKQKYGSDGQRPQFGYHSQIAPKPDTEKWVQVDLGRKVQAGHIVLFPAFDNYNNIGAGFGFPPRFKVEVADDAAFKTGVRVVHDATSRDLPNPGTTEILIATGNTPYRAVRVTATRLAPRKNDYIFALAEIQVLSPVGDRLVSKGEKIHVTALDSIESSPRWGRDNLIDGIYYQELAHPAARDEWRQLRRQRQAIEEEIRTPETQRELASLKERLGTLRQQLKAIPEGEWVYAVASTFKNQGKFTPTGGRPRSIRLLERGDLRTPGPLMHPGAPEALPASPGAFDSVTSQDEGLARLELARYLVDPENPLVWRSIVNRVWLHHFGRGIVNSPNDFGRMGEAPTHPDLLDWLAVWFRDEAGRSFKSLHRLLVTSATYRQGSGHRPDMAAEDQANAYYWRAQRRRLSAEEIRDSVLQLSGQLRLEMGGPSFQDFVIEKPQHSPHYQYHLHDPADPTTHRRSIYRFIVRSQTHPFLTTLDCADPSQMVPRRDETTTAVQALALLNNPFMESMAGIWAERLENLHANVPAQLEQALVAALGRPATNEERQAFTTFAGQHGLANACRLIFNLNEFIYVD